MKIKTIQLFIIFILFILVTPQSSGKDPYFTYSTQLNVGDVFTWKVNNLVENGIAITEPRNELDERSIWRKLVEGSEFEMEIIKDISELNTYEEIYDTAEYFQINVDGDSFGEIALIRFLVYNVNYYDGIHEGNYFEIVASEGEDSMIRPKNAIITIQGNEYTEIRESETSKFNRRIDWKLGITNYYYSEFFDLGNIFCFERIIQLNEESSPNILQFFNFRQTVPILIFLVFLKTLKTSKYRRSR